MHAQITLSLAQAHTSDLRHHAAARSTDAGSPVRHRRLPRLRLRSRSLGGASVRLALPRG